MFEAGLEIVSAPRRRLPMRMTSPARRFVRKPQMFISPGRGVGDRLEIAQFLEGSFSAVSKLFASIGSFCRMF